MLKEIIKQTTLFLLFFCYSLAAHHMTMFVYMDSSDDLSDMAIKNLNALAEGGSHKNLTILAQLHAFGNCAFRYKIDKNAVLCLNQVTLQNAQQDFIDAACWAFTQYPAQHHILILWNHGFGILDPQWNEISKAWEAEDDIAQHLACEFCPKKRSLLQDIFDNHAHHHRGFMFNKDNRSYLKTDQLIEAIQIISDQLDKKIDILGFDTCMGAMFEIASQVAPYVHYYLGSQNCEMRDGWDYAAITEYMQTVRNPREIALAIVESFENYCAPRTIDGGYTLSALDLSYMQELQKLLNTLATQLVNLPSSVPVQETLLRARSKSPKFCYIPMYTDLHTFCSYLYEEIILLPENREKNDLIKTIQQLCSLIDKATIARCQGYNMTNLVHGLSIYFPFAHIDSSYKNNKFVQKSSWLRLLEMATQQSCQA